MAKVMVVDDAYSELQLMECDGDALEDKVTRDRACGRRQGADDYLGTPVTSDQLLGMVGRFVH